MVDVIVLVKSCSSEKHCRFNILIDWFIFDFKSSFEAENFAGSTLTSNHVIVAKNVLEKLKL